MYLLRYRPAQGLARHADPGAGPAGGRRDHRRGDDGRETGTGLEPAAAPRPIAYTSTAFPMLTGTLVTVAGFLPIALAKSSTGEYTRVRSSRSSAIALIAVVAGGGGVHSAARLHAPARAQDASAAVPERRTNTTSTTRQFYARLRGWVRWCVERRCVVLGGHGGCCSSSAHRAGFRLVPQQFFPSSDRPELLVDVRLQEGASFDATAARGQAAREAAAGHAPEIDHYVSFVGTGAPRFYLPLDQQLRAAEFRAVRRHGEVGRGAREAARGALEPMLRRAVPGGARARCRGWKTVRRWAIRCSSA